MLQLQGRVQGWKLLLRCQTPPGAAAPGGQGQAGRRHLLQYLQWWESAAGGCLEVMP
jgi:hypothetical protein